MGTKAENIAGETNGVAKASQDKLEAALATRVTVMPSRVWEQWPGEPDDWYAKFQVFMSLGVNRTLLDAYRMLYASNQQAEMAISGIKHDIVLPSVPSGSWFKISQKWRWNDRAARYDVYALSALVPQTVTMIFQTIGEFANVTLASLKAGDIKPTQWNELKEAVVTLAGYISPEIIQATVANAALTNITTDDGQLAATEDSD